MNDVALCGCLSLPMWDAEKRPKDDEGGIDWRDALLLRRDLSRERRSSRDNKRFRTDKKERAVTEPFSRQESNKHLLHAYVIRQAFSRASTTCFSSLLQKKRKKKRKKHYCCCCALHISCFFFFFCFVSLGGSLASLSTTRLARYFSVRHLPRRQEASWRSYRVPFTRLFLFLLQE